MHAGESYAFCTLFSLVRKSRTENNASMSNETLESLVIQKAASLHQGRCHSQQFSTAMIRSTKSATYHAVSHTDTEGAAQDTAEWSRNELQLT